MVGMCLGRGNWAIEESKEGLIKWIKRYTMYAYQLSVMNTFIMHYKHTLVKLFNYTYDEIRLEGHTN